MPMSARCRCYLLQLAATAIRHALLRLRYDAMLPLQKACYYAIHTPQELLLPAIMLTFRLLLARRHNYLLDV